MQLQVVVVVAAAAAVGADDFVEAGVAVDDPDVLGDGNEVGQDAI